MRLVRLTLFFSLFAMLSSPSLSANEGASEDYWDEVTTGDNAETADTVGEIGNTVAEMIGTPEVNTHDGAEKGDTVVGETTGKGDGGCSVSYLSATGISAMLFLMVFLLSLVFIFRGLKREHD